MREPATIVFVDALAEYYLDRYRDELAVVRDLPSRVGIEPGMGFSINIKAELLAGLTPDDLGFFCKWNYRPEPAFRVPGWARILGGLFDGHQLTSRLAHRVLSRVIGTDLFTIPFDEIDLFEPVGIPEAYLEDFPHATVLSEGGFRRVVHGPGMASDRAVTEAAVALMSSSDNLYVTLIEPDAVGHRQGPHSAGMARKLEEVASQVEALWSAHRAAGRGVFLLFSDHGMAPVTNHPWFDPADHFGPPGHRRYACFSDSTMLRFWVFDDSLRDRIGERLANLEWGTVLGAEERERFGITSMAHGDILFLVDEGVIPTPSHVGGKHPRAVGMHGYHPDLESQRGLAAWWTPADVEGESGAVEPAAEPRRIRARDLPALWRRISEGPQSAAGASGGEGER